MRSTSARPRRAAASARCRSRAATTRRAAGRPRRPAPAGNAGSSWEKTVSGGPVPAASSASTGATMRQVGQSCLTTATSPSGRPTAADPYFVVAWLTCRGPRSERGRAAQRHLLRGPGFDSLPVRTQPPLRRQHGVRGARGARHAHPIVLDLGTGLRFWGEHAARRRVVPGRRARHPPALGPRAGAAVLRSDRSARAPGSTSTDRGRRRDRARGGVRGVHAPAVLPGARQAICAARSRSTTLADARVDDRRRPRCWPGDVPHVGATNGYRVEMGRRLRRLHQRPPAAARRRTTVADVVLELCDGVDLVIHDAQYTARRVRA